MAEQTLSILEDFPPVEYEQWRGVVEESLKGAPFEKKLVTHTYEGVDLQPLYTQSDRLGEGDFSGLPGQAPFVRGFAPLGAAVCGWDLRQEHSLPEPEAINQAILADLEGGVTSLLLVLDRAARAGLDPDDSRAAGLVGTEGLMAYQVNDLDEALKDVQLPLVGIALEAGAAFVPAAAMLAGLWKKRDHNLEKLRVAFNADPLAVLAREGSLPMSLDTALGQMAELAKWSAQRCPHSTAVGVDTSPYHHAGATAAQDLAFAMATSVAYLRKLTEAGMSLEEAASQILLRMSVGTHHFLAIAKLRAARQLWARVIEACGGSPADAPLQLHVRLSDRVLTERDPYVNLLRNTVGVFAAGVGGATSITSVPFDQTTGQSDEFSRRVARNTGLILQEEAHLHRVVDPAGGSWFLEKLTDDMAEEAWKIFQAVEGEGGMIKALESGWIAGQIDSAFAPRSKDISTRKEGITGVSEFPNLQEERIDRPAPDPQELAAAAVKRISSKPEQADLEKLAAEHKSVVDAAVAAAAAGSSLGQLAQGLGLHTEETSITPLVARSFAEPYEELRDACDAWQAQHGSPPSVFLANLGPIAHHTARATYSKSFFEAGGFEVLSNDGFNDADAAAQAFAESGAKIAVICSSDKLYPDLVPDTAAKLKAAGARNIILAGRPGENEEAWRSAGVDRFIYISCDVLSTLRELLTEEGVLSS